jgi:hypothetical protein
MVCGRRNERYCGTSRRSRHTIYKRDSGSQRELDQRLRALYTASSVYLTRLRARYDLDHAPGWLERESLAP